MQANTSTHMCEMIPIMALGQHNQMMNFSQEEHLDEQYGGQPMYQGGFTYREALLAAQDHLDDHVEIDNKPLLQEDYDQLSVKINIITEQLSEEFELRNHKLNTGKWTDAESQQFIDSKYFHNFLLSTFCSPKISWKTMDTGSKMYTYKDK